MKNLFNTIFLCALLALAPAAFSGRDGGYAAFAQNNVTVTGTVVDELGEPLLGAGIVVKDTTTGTTADLDGNFVLTVPEGSVAEVSVPGEKGSKTYAPGEYRISRKSPVSR
jgi:type 1 fimbria pilin